MHECVRVHAPTLHRNANFASAFFASKRKCSLHRNAHNDGMNAIQNERDRLQEALVNFYSAAKQAGAIKSVNVWAKASQVSASTINPVLNGTANKRLEDETYFKLADGASKLLGRPVSIEELKGEEPKTSALTDLQRRALDALAKLPEDRQEEEIDKLEYLAGRHQKKTGPPPQDA
jgi:transcriptional regulator with XRE-family HTH domain